MFCLLALAVISLVCGSEVFVQDVVFSILGTIIDGTENSRRTGNGSYRLYLLWQTESSNKMECSYCHYNIQDKDVMRKYTDDDRKIDYSVDTFVFPTEYNSDIPHYEIDKQKILLHILKELVELFSGVDVYANGDSCCYTFTLDW